MAVLAGERRGSGDQHADLLEALGQQRQENAALFADLRARADPPVVVPAVAVPAVANRRGLRLRWSSPFHDSNERLLITRRALLNT